MPVPSIPDAGSLVDALSDGQVCLLDVRSPAEYAHARIPGALNLPLLDNEARHDVGLTYKQSGRSAAVRKGFELVGPRFAQIIDEAGRLAGGRTVMMYCWRGGLRSGIMSWLLATAGQRVSVLTGGYKAFRRWALERLTEPRKLIVLGGRTGSGKTEMLHALRDAGEPVIDLEALASHKGSAFGGLGQPPQPGNEQFENQLALAWHAADPGRPVWIENESRLIGTCLLPDTVYAGIREAPVVEMQLPRQIRMERILREYGHFPVEKLREKTDQVRKRLGGLAHAQAVEALDEGRMEEWCDILLSYYDRTYAFSNRKRTASTILPFEMKDDDMKAQVSHLLRTARQASEVSP